MYEYGGTDDPQIFTHAPVDGFTFTETTARTLYPAGMEFTVGVVSEGGEITNVHVGAKRRRKISRNALRPNGTPRWKNG